MSYADLLTDRCDIFHLMENQETAAYGVPGETEYTYPVSPDLQQVLCLFGKESLQVNKNEPGVTIVQSFLVHFFVDSGIRFNDKVIFNGITYRLEIPRNVRTHHIEVRAVRDDSI
ncbi:DUF3599 family protein [Bacillus sp. ISL-75]|uniref:DUF3599 family protein n=1 Tax=Bacillus sp. ISL-75 TaxID=2819137 RepID=UPI001BE73371|nr:DUF3599 family protein [Bacillus sp. ISL-75]MBT2727842.1 DUF3599 family protein [Bacillus sp. ISL-75]